MLHLARVGAFQIVSWNSGHCYEIILRDTLRQSGEDFETELLLSQGLIFKAYKMYITAIFTHLIAKLYKNKNLRCSFKATADTAVKGKICSICSMPELSEDFSRLSWNEVYINIGCDTASWCARNSCEKRYSLIVLLSVTSAYTWRRKGGHLKCDVFLSIFLWNKGRFLSFEWLK